MHFCCVLRLRRAFPHEELCSMGVPLKNKDVTRFVIVLDWSSTDDFLWHFP
ncbi:hypothetical protein SERLADRAFT_463978 [Serpula lacrymans var. lacrymans S7.9]|uniref:Uncharacterized protein n=1 Tax=Serpula lacrymans var. lacrymans (strain S7.9) TaxID=578457 RepID=F8NQX6_SERL9|nr:uncharacterized protein SERLADRAFT_463978 [Serpula lacrymans var. lacrymans S7.9]EGO26679.1 hypothetical protein SERLADRAFT_463978 [Serpula lacrymans var. lacrymans S7.9]